MSYDRKLQEFLPHPPGPRLLLLELRFLSVHVLIFFNSLLTTYTYKVSINTLTKCMGQSVVDGAWKDHTSPFCGLYLPVRMAFANHSAILPEILLGGGD